MHFDLALDELRDYAPDLAAPADLDQFWSETLAEARSFDLAATFVPADTPLTLVDTYDVTFAGFGGSPVKAWLHVPAGTTEPLPAVIQYLGYGGGRGLAHERTMWATAGFAHVVMDTRGQGSGWAVGDTGDPDGSGAPSLPGFVTQGITNPADYYYRRVYTDAVRAVEAARQHPLVDPRRVAVAGGSQGGAIAIAAAALVDDLAAVIADVPFLSHVRRAVTLVDTPPYEEIARYIKAHRDHEETVFATLGYFDGAVLAPRANAPALFSVGLMDTTCPPSTVFASFNRYGGPGFADREIVVYPFNGHEGGEGFQAARAITWLRDRLNL